MNITKQQLRKIIKEQLSLDDVIEDVSFISSQGDDTRKGRFQSSDDHRSRKSGVRLEDPGTSSIPIADAATGNNAGVSLWQRTHLSDGLLHA